MSLTANLITLFHIDGQVRGLRSRLETASRYLESQTDRVQDLRDQQAELQVRQRQTEATVANLEVEGAGIDERLEKLRNELNGATTNKQYTAVLTELNTIKLSRSDLDDRELEELDKVEQNKTQIEALAAQIEEREKVRLVAAAELKRRHEDVGERLQELETEREIAAAVIPAADLKIFDEMAHSYDGEAMAPVEEIDRRHRDYVCGSCNLHLPFEAIAALLGAGDTLVRCTACGRILYLHEETRGALSKK